MSSVFIYRWALVQLFGIAGLAWVWERGWAEMVVSADVSRVSFAIMGLFALAWLECARWVARMARRMSRGSLYRAGREEHERARRRWLHKASEWMVQLGLLGTVIGMVMAFSSVSADAASSVEGVRALVSQLMRGVGVALYTTLVGIVFGLWHELNVRMMETAAAEYWHGDGR